MKYLIVTCLFLGSWAHAELNVANSTMRCAVMPGQYVGYQYEHVKEVGLVAKIDGEGKVRSELLLQSKYDDSAEPYVFSKPVTEVFKLGRSFKKNRIGATKYAHDMDQPGANPEFDEIVGHFVLEQDPISGIFKGSISTDGLYFGLSCTQVKSAETTPPPIGGRKLDF